MATATKEKSKKDSAVELKYDSVEAMRISRKFAEEARKNWL